MEPLSSDRLPRPVRAAMHEAEMQRRALIAAAELRRGARLDRDLAAGVASGFGDLCEMAEAGGFVASPHDLGAALKIGGRAYR